MSIGLWVRGARPKTLATSIASVMVGATMAYAHIEQSGTCIAIYPEPAFCATAREQQTLLMDRFWPVTILCLLVALFLQIAVNYAIPMASAALTPGVTRTNRNQANPSD